MVDPAYYFAPMLQCVVFGQIRQAMGFRRFSMRGMQKVKGEWALVGTCHNVRKLWTARRAGLLTTLA